MPELNAKLFGTPAVSVDGREITLPYKKADALLYYLILKRKTTRSELIGLLYEDTDSATALKNLRHAIYTIRKAFAFDPFVPGQRSIVEFSADVEIACDVYDFERGDMLSAYHGEFLKDFNVSHSSAFDAWLSDQRNLYQSQYLHQLLAAEKEAYYAGKLDLAEKYGTEYIAIDPLEESAFSTLMQVYRDQKKFRKALGLYHTLCKNLSDEFSISPLKETSALYYQIVDAWNTSTYKLEVGSDQQLIGKDAVLHKLVSLCNGSRLESDKICALIQGKTGVGKTYLINYILHQYDFSGWAICQASCYQSEMNTVLAPWNTIMLQLIPKFESENIRIPDVYSFTHERVKAMLSQRQSESARRILHLRAAQYLEAQLGSDGSTDLYDQLVQHFTAGGDTFKAFKYKVLSLDAFAGMCYELMPILTDGSDALTVKEDGLTGYFQILERELASLRSTQFGANAKELDQLERQLLYVESRYYIHGGEYDAGLPVVGQLLKSSTTAGDWQMAANAHLQFIYYAIQTYDLPVMREHLRLGMQYKSRLENTPDWGKFLRLQGLMYLMIGEYDKCRSWLDRSISFFESLDADGEGRYVISIAGAYNYIAETYRLERNFDKALEYYDKAILFNQRRGSYPGAAIIYTDYGVAAYQSGEKEVARELLSYAEELYQSFHEYSQMPIALSYLALFDVEDGQYVSAAARLSKALDVGRKMGSPWWNGITLYITWKIRLLLEKQAINVPELSVLWPQDKRKHCIECLDCLHRLEPRTETAEMEQTLEALNAEKAES